MKESKAAYLWLGSVLGCLATGAAMSLYQDALGLDAYIALAREHWINPAISVPCAVVSLVVVVAVYALAYMRGMKA